MTLNKTDGNTFTDASVVEDGTYEYKIQVTSNNDKFSGTFSDVFAIKIDTQAPDVPNVTVISPRTNDKSPTWSWNEISDAIKYHIKLIKKETEDNVLFESSDFTDTSFTHESVLDDGTYELLVASFDDSDNKSEFGIGKIIVDTNPPSLPILQEPTSPTNNKKPTWTWNENSDVIKYGIIFGGGSEILTTNTSFTPEEELNDGVYVFKIKAFDDVGNESEYVESSVTIDATAPILVTITSNELTNNRKPTWSWNAVNGAVEYGVKLNSDVEIKQVETTFTSPVELSDGTHTLRVRSRDSVGNWSDYSVSEIVVDKTPPQKPNPSSVSPTSNKRPTWSWDDSSDAVLYELRINNGSTFTQTENSYQPNTDFVDGKYTLYIRAKDEVGNYTEYATSEVIVDSQAPSVPQPTSVTPTTNKIPTWSCLKLMMRLLMV